ncbi:MAG: hypothetical protein JXR96_30720, partial [Deltaproteobacteria bacterium]|nr:hypothetical protein [Deltaproteobacteria bacterium]
MSARTGLAALLVLAAASSCGHDPAPHLPGAVRLAPLPSTQRKPDDLGGMPLKALYVLPRTDADGRPAGIASEDQQLALIDFVAVLDGQGGLHIQDQLHATVGAASRYQKIPLEAIALGSPQGRFSADRKLFTPSLDTLVALDSGYAIEVELGPLRRKLVYRPNYDASFYSPFDRSGEAGALGPAGAFGDGGEGGKRGSDGDDGQRGSSGMRGGDGADGGDGGHGKRGSDGTRAADGQPGDPGPDLDVLVRPIYSKFYPDEELVFVRVRAAYRHRFSGGAYRSEERNYTFHRDQPFRICSLGGAGGAG